MTTRGAEIRFENIAKRYGAVDALHPTSLNIEAGEFFSIIGPSGSGKTTLLGVTAGYVAPSGGRILVNGENIVGVPPFRRDIGMVFQNYALFQHMSVADNVSFPLRMRGADKAEIAERVKRILAMVQLEQLAARRPSQLSGGQQQRVALARAAIYDPVLLLMDEPLSALDKNLREAMQDEIKQFQAALDSTVLYVTHDQSEAAAISHRIAIMNHGRLEQVGTPRDLYEHPVNRFVASFLGEANLFDLVGVSAHGSGASCNATSGLTIYSATAPNGHAQCACVRPEAMGLSVEPVTEDNVIEGEVVDATYTAGSLRYRVRVASDLIVTKREPSQRGLALIARGTKVHLHWRAEDTLLVDDG
ncbi:MAG: ABC transporter ATP-binding protein [Gammaproteobacteria bacterium]